MRRAKSFPQSTRTDRHHRSLGRAARYRAECRWQSLTVTVSNQGKAGASNMKELEFWSANIWVVEAPLRFFGVPFGTRMTVVRLGDGSLLLHSPIHISSSLRGAIDQLGAVEHIVSPNKLHHLFIDSAMAAYPGAKLYLPPGLIEKRPDLSAGTALTDSPPQAWADDMDQLVIRGSRRMQEVVFFHATSRTLIVADLCEHFGPHSPPLTRALARLTRMYGRPRMPPDWQLSFRDREALRDSFSRLLSWDFDAVILAHGALLRSGAKSIFRREYAWALR